MQPKARATAAASPAPANASRVALERLPGASCAATIYGLHDTIPIAPGGECQAELDPLVVDDDDHGWPKPNTLLDRFWNLPENPFQSNGSGDNDDYPRWIGVHGPWPGDAWLAVEHGLTGATSIGKDLSTRGDRAWIDVLRWDAGAWHVRLSVWAFDETRFLGFGEWPGGRIITPLIGPVMETSWSSRAAGTKVRQSNELVVLQGAPTRDLPALPRETGTEPIAFASFASGHAVLLSVDRAKTDLVAFRWSPGMAKPTREVLEGVGDIYPRDDVGAPERPIVDRPSEHLLAFAPDDLYVIGRARESERTWRPVMVHFDGSTWSKTQLPGRECQLDKADGVLWALCFDEHPSLWRQLPGGKLERLDLSLQTGTPGASFEPTGIWARGHDELWLTSESELQPWYRETVFRDAARVRASLLEPKR